MTKKIQKTTVKSIFERNGKILLVKDSKGVWELPGGRINHGEDPKEALKRELKEELGWTNIDIKNIIDSWSFTSKVNGTHYHFIVLAYACASNEQNIKENGEHIEYKWVPSEKIDALDMKDGYKKTIKKFLGEPT